ncbi:MAG: membrane dipeptidase [Cyclobacteriaceae bacterium]|nr:membrane dipeptidase [Cyclobacteriaceae bacterium]MDH5249987.1 membrane dipeptidase [Cyclobacteriaceae bacterium]
MFIIDAHLDLATNAISLNRDLTKSVGSIREKEKQLGWTDTQDRGHGTVALPELRKGNVGLVVATIISRYSAGGNPLPTLNLPGWHSPEQAFAYGQAQLAWYKVMEDVGEMVQITSWPQLQHHIDLWADSDVANTKKPIGYILSLEGADSIINFRYLEKYHAQGLRAIGPAHFGPGRYAAGTHADGSGLTAIGKELLREMDRLKIILDATHLTDKGFFEALNIFNGVVWASHQNCRALVPGERQFSDDQIKLIIERDGVIGGALDTWMLYPDFEMGKNDPKALGINLEKLVDHFDHICQLAGNCMHIGFGTDLDGLFGTEQTPYDMDTIADIVKFEEILARRGYTREDMNNIYCDNWLRIIKKAWM